MSTLQDIAAALADRYRVERELGQGGMATIFLARDLKLGRPVAIKVLHTELAHALGPERFLLEITTTAQFDHPYILPLLDSGVIEPAPATRDPRLLYYVMPYVEGETLRARLLREKQLPLEDALQVAREVADALGYAHARNVVHRDIKPENIMLSGGHARVADFGIARAIDVAGSDRLTETGLAVGTPAYMSPEQSMAERDIDGRSDLYALGVVLYEMLAGEPPFTGPTAQAIVAKRMTAPVPSVRTVREAVPESVDHALSVVMARAPADRFTTAAQLVDALGRQVTPTPGIAAPRQSRVGWPVWIGAALALALLGGWMFARSRRPHLLPSASVIAVLPFMPSTADTALTRLGRDLALTIAFNLDGVGGIRTAFPQLVLAAADEDRNTGGAVDAVAIGRKVGAGSVMVGDLVRNGANIRLDLRLLSTAGDSAPLARATIVNTPDSISALTDSVTWAILQQVWQRGTPPSPSYANLTTRSVPALRAFLEGEQLVVAGRWTEAIEAYGAAIKADSSFWLAGWRYNSAQGWTERPDYNERLEQGYRSHLEAFGARDRQLIEVEIGENTFTWVDYLARLRALTQRFPQDWPVWSYYADELWHVGATVGYTRAEVRAALQRAVDLNPRLVPMWAHLFNASVGHDSAQAARALRALTTLGAYARDRSETGHEGGLADRLLLSAGGPLPPATLDSLVSALSEEQDSFRRFVANYTFILDGLPQAQVQFSRALLQHDPNGPFAHNALEAMAYAWLARGAWDSAMVAFDRLVVIRPLQAIKAYKVSVAGAWMGVVDTTPALRWRAASLRALAQVPRDSVLTRKYSGAEMAWADGMLAVLRHDLHGLEQSRASVRQSDIFSAAFYDRSLAGFALDMEGNRRAAADSLAALDLEARDAEMGAGPDARDPFARSLNHLLASRLLLEQGDTSQALKLLTWHEAQPAPSFDPVRFQMFAALAYLEMARIEEAQGHTDLARDYYQQFLRRYDMPPPAHQQLVDEARASLQKLGASGDPAKP